MKDVFCPQCGSPLAKAGPLLGLCPRCVLDHSMDDQEQVVALFPELEIQAEIGRGGMGIVFRAKQKRLDRLVALKIISPQLVSEPKFEERFEREARALARIAHAGIVGVHDFGVREGTYFLLMEFVDGVSLRQALKAESIDPKEALAIVPQICAALEFAHGHGVVHRDIKPENILLAVGGQVKIADFGLAKLGGDADQALTRTSQILGTPHYMAPEQVSRPLEVDHRADIYSLGVVLYEMLTGELPVGSFPPPSRQANVDARLDDVVLRTLEREPDRRYQHASEIQSDIEELHHPGAAGSDPATRSSDHLQGWSRWLQPIAGGPWLVLLLSLFAGLSWLYLCHVRRLWQPGQPNPAFFAGSYVFFFLAYFDSRAGMFSGYQRPAARALGAFACAALVLAIALTSGDERVPFGFIVLAACIAATGHLLFLDRWVEGGQPDLLAIGTAFLIAAALLYPAVGSQLAKSVNYASGIGALCLCASGAARIPERLYRPFGRADWNMMARSLGLALILASIYFRKEF